MCACVCSSVCVYVELDRIGNRLFVESSTRKVYQSQDKVTLGILLTKGIYDEPLVFVRAYPRTYCQPVKKQKFYSSHDIQKTRLNCGAAIQGVRGEGGNEPMKTTWNQTFYSNRNNFTNHKSTASVRRDRQYRYIVRLLTSSADYKQRCDLRGSYGQQQPQRTREINA